MHSSIYLCTLFFFILSLWIVVTLSVTPSFPPFLCSNCRTSSNCVNNNRSRVSSVSLSLFVTSCDPPPPLKSITHSFIHSFIRALKVLFIVGFFFLFKCQPLWPHSCCFLRCRRRRPTFRLTVDTRRADLSRKTWDSVVHNSLWCTWLSLRIVFCFFFLIVFYFAFLQQSGWLSSFSF